MTTHSGSPSGPVPRWIPPGLIAVLVVFSATFAAVQATLPGQASHVTTALFLATLVLEATAIASAARARTAFAQGDPSYRVWTLIVVFLGLRFVADIRFATILLGLVPSLHENPSTAVFVYIVVLRYLFTIGDVALIAALVIMIRSCRKAGLELRLRAVDAVAMTAVVIMPLLTLTFPAIVSDPSLRTYWKVAAVMAAIIGVLCVILLRLVLYFGAGALAHVWLAVLIACTARTVSFVSTAILSRVAAPGVDDFVDQCYFWIFAGWWLLAALHQRAMFSYASSGQKT